MDGIFFEIIAEREVAEHFKKSMMTRRAAYVFNIAGTNTFLACGYTRTRRYQFTRKKRF